MGQGDYTLGIDVGDETVVTAVCPADGAARRLEPAVSPEDTAPAPAPGHALRRIGAPAPMYLAGRPVDPATVVAQLVRRVTEQATAAEGSAPAWTVLTVPPSWGRHRRDLLTAALRDTGLTAVSVESGAVAVLRRHRDAGSVPEGAPVVVVDVGASTTDTAVLRATEEDVQTLAVPPAPLPWGGRDVDDAVVQLVGECLAEEDDGSTAGPAAFKSACVAAKEALSTDSVACVELPGAEGPIALRLVREDLEELVAEPLQALVAVVRRAVAEAGLEVADLAAVVLAGGTAAVPLVAETLSAELDRPVVVEAEPALTAALGAAALAARPSTAAEQPAAAPEPDGDDDADPVPALPAAAGAARPPRTARAGRRPGTPPGATRPPARSGSRPPVPTPDLQSRRHAARVGVVLSAFLAIVVGVAAAVSTDWSATTGQQAVAGTVAPQQTGAADQPDDGDDEGSGLSPAAAEGRADEQDRDRSDRANGSAKPVGSSTGASTSRSGSSSAATSSAAGTTSGARPAGSTPPGSSGPGTTGPGTTGPGSTAQTGGPSSTGGPGTTPPTTGQPTTAPPPVTDPPVSTPPPSTSNPPEPEPTPVTDPPVTTAPVVQPEPEPTATTEEPPPAGTPAAADAVVPGQP